MSVAAGPMLRRAACASALLGCLALAAASATAQGRAPAAAPDVPDAREIIDALKPNAGRTRNLAVRPVSAPAAPAAVVPGAAPAAPAAPAADAAAGPPSVSLPIQFDANSARVRPASGPVLGELVAAMLSPELEGTRFVIEGHTDARGGAAANQRLSQERADEVRLYLMALGVPPARLRAVGKGSSEPANPADPLAPENRRVRVVAVE